MNGVRKTVWLIPILFFFSCGKGTIDIPVSERLETIEVGVEGKNYLSSDLFLNGQIVELETTEDSYLASIGRVYRDGGYLYILDDRLHSVLLFDTTGRFVRKIHDLGRGPGEYIQLSDFSIAENGSLLLMADIPGKVIIRAQDGSLAGQIPLEKAYMDLCSSGDSLFFLDPPSSKTAFSCLNQITGSISSYQKAIPAYNSFYIHGRFLTKTNQQILMTRRFDNTVYGVDRHFVKSAEILFKGNKFITESELKEYRESPLFFDFCRKNNRVFSIVDCQQLSEVWVFNTNLPYCFLYSSKTGKQYVVSDIEDEQHHLHLGGFSRVSINGNTDDQVCFVLREDGLKQLGKSEKENPVLVFYTIRKDL